MLSIIICFIVSMAALVLCVVVHNETVKLAKFLNKFIVIAIESSTIQAESIKKIKETLEAKIEGEK